MIDKNDVVPGRKYLVRFLGNKLDKAWKEPKVCVVRQPFLIKPVLLEFTIVGSDSTRFYCPTSKYSDHYEIIQELGD